MFGFLSPSVTLFTALIRSFKLSPHILKQAKLLGIEPPQIVTTPSLLHKSLLERDWRQLPMLFDVPSNSQIFGELICSAGIEGILYPSKQTQKDCLVVFPANFDHTSSFIALDDAPPHVNVPTRIDATNWRISQLEFKDLVQSAT